MKTIQVCISDNVFDLVERYCKYMGLSRSAFCSMAIGEKVMAYENGYKVLSDTFGATLGDIVKHTNSEPNAKE